MKTGVEQVSGNIFLRKWMSFEEGEQLEGHKHNFDHTTIVFKGAVHVIAVSEDGTKRQKTFNAPSHFLVKAGVEHEITALENGTEFWCVYSHREIQTDGSDIVVQEYTGWDKSYT